MISDSEAKATRPDGKSLMELQKWLKIYLQTPHWDARRAIALERAGFMCEACCSTGFLQVHHLRYSSLFNEPDEDLMSICSNCHRLAHDELFERSIRGLSPEEKRKAIIKMCSKKMEKFPKATFRPPNPFKRWRK